MGVKKVVKNANGNGRTAATNGSAQRAGGPLAEALVGREWPRNPELILGDYDNAPWVKTGRVFTRALRMHQHVSEPIPAGESAITSMCVGENGKIYGATSGKRSHLFFYDPAPTGDGVVDIGVLEGVTGVRRALVSKGTRIYAGASETSDAEGGAIYVHDTAPDYQDEFRAYKGWIERLTVPVKGEGIAALCAHPRLPVLYGISSVTGTFFRCEVETGKVKRYGSVSKDAMFSRTLVMDNNGWVYGTHSLGTLYRFREEFRKIEDLGICIPTVAGREFYNQLDSAVYEPESGLIYGAGTADGVLFSFNPRSQDMRSLGKVIAEPRVRALTAANDGSIYGIAGCEDGMGHLFQYDPKRSELKDLGIMLAASEIWRRGFEFDAACTGRDGTLYFGESERDSHLFLYFPPHPAPGTRPSNYDDDIPF